jgi:alpha-glucosidase
MLAGPMDYTPGSMRNKTRSLFKPIDPGLPSTQGTRCHELAMYIVYDQPFAMLCDSPAEYRKYADILKYLSAVPTDFDETKILDAKLGKYAVVAKRKGDQWFVGAMSSWDQKTVDLDFSFLPSGKTYQAEIYTDGKEAAVDAEKYDHRTITINRQSTVKVELAQGGGAIVYLHP